MLPIAPQKPLLEHTLELLRDQGFDDFIINLHYLPEKITEYFGDGKRYGVSIRYSDERGEILDTAGALVKMRAMLADNFLVQYGDEVHFLDVAAVFDEHVKRSALATIVLKTSDEPQNGDVAEIDRETHRIVNWHFRPHAFMSFDHERFLNAGIYVFSKRILDYIPAAGPFRLETGVLNVLVGEDAPFYGFITNENVLDVGTIEKYAMAREWYAAKHGF
jgi:NDP-sugar pyrophosphorylase family protein